MNFKKNNLLVYAVRCTGILVMFLVLVAAVKIVKIVREAQGRGGPGSYYKMLKVIPEGKSLEILEIKKSWYKVKYEDVEVWISENSLTMEKEKESTSKSVFDSFSFDTVSATASPAVLTAAIKGFWTRYSRTQSKDLVELPVNGFDIPVEQYESFARERSRAVSRDDLVKKYRLRSSYKKPKISYEREHSIGYTCASSIADAPLMEDEDLIRYIHSVGWYIAESTERYDINYIYYILDTDSVNAISCPGGYIVLTRGLLELLHDESELEALLAHEMSHIIAGHGMTQIIEDKVRIKADTAFDALARETSPASEVEKDLIAVTNRAISIATGPKLDEYEFEADEMAIRYLARSGYDINGHMRLLNTVMTKHEANIDIFDLNYRNHPDFKERLKRSEKELRRYRNYTGSQFSETFRKYMTF